MAVMSLFSTPFTLGLCKIQIMSQAGSWEETSLECKWNINSLVTRLVTGDYINLSNKYWIHLRLTLTDYKADSYGTVWLHYTDTRSRSDSNICDCQIYPIIALHSLTPITFSTADRSNWRMIRKFQIVQNTEKHPVLVPGKLHI